jgi:hypothetical protein
VRSIRFSGCATGRRGSAGPLFAVETTRRELALRFPRGDRRRFQFCIERLQSLRRLFLQLCNFATFVSRSRVRSVGHPGTTSCGFEASEPIPFPGADSIFSSGCGAISGRLRQPVALAPEPEYPNYDFSKSRPPNFARASRPPDPFGTLRTPYAHVTLNSVFSKEKSTLSTGALRGARAPDKPQVIFTNRVFRRERAVHWRDAGYGDLP